MLSTDPIDWLLDDDGDLVVTDDVAFVSGKEAVAQLIRIAVQEFRGEIFFDRTRGVPYLPNDIVSEEQALLGQKFNATKANAAYRDAIDGVPGVASINDVAVTFDRATRTMSASWIVITEFGDTIEDSVLVPA